MKLLVLLTFCFGFVVCIPSTWEYPEYPEYYPEYYTEYPIYPEHRGNLKKPEISFTDLNWIYLR